MNRLTIAATAGAVLLSACGDRTAGQAAGGLSGRPDLALQQQQRSTEAELQAAITAFLEVYEDTGNPFEARRQAKAKHLALFVNNPVLSRNFDALTALAWTSQGGEWAGAVCYMRGFQFGTAHHDQCIYEVKMEEGGEQPREPEAVVPQVSQPAAVAQPQDAKVYSADECIGPVIMGRCQGTILPNKAYHPTCYGTWLNGECTGPMF
jgi:hypothetical protein